MLEILLNMLQVIVAVKGLAFHLVEIRIAV